MGQDEQEGSARKISMNEPLFPIRPLVDRMPAEPLVLEPYREGTTWLFDDPVAGLHREPFVGDVNGMLDRLSSTIPDAEKGFRLLVFHQPFAGHQVVYHWVRTDPIEGNWYRTDDTGEEGWLCPSLFCYFPEVPEKLYAKAEAKRVSGGRA